MMIQGFRSIALLALACLASFAQAGPKEDIDAAEDRRYDTMIAGDAAALGAVLGDEFIYHQPTGRVQDKAGYVKQVTGGDVKLYKAERYDVKINVYGDTATVTGSTLVDAEMGGKAMRMDLRYLNVWVNRDGRWQLVARQSAVKPPPK